MVGNLDEGLDALRTSAECNPMNYSIAENLLTRLGLMKKYVDRITPRRRE